MKVIRANAHLKTLQEETRAFFDRSPYGVVDDFDPETSRYTFRVAVFESPPPQWGVIVGDIVHNLSSALEYIAWELVKLNGNEPTEGVTGFPIYESEAVFLKDGRGERMMQGIRDDHREHIKSLQPYHRGDRAREDPLALLRRLWNVDKHRVPLTTLGTRQTAEWTPVPVRDVEDRFGMVSLAVTGPLEDGTPLGFVEVFPTGPNPKVQMEGGAKADVVFSNPDVAGASVYTSLLAAGHAVSNILTYFVPEFG